ncbi:DUF222 domain-containing protein, partial [Microtetraspora glauca]
MASALALAVVPESAGVCLAEVEDLLFARDRLVSAVAARVERVHAAGAARAHGHASTKLWLRTAAGMSVAGAGRLVALAVELARLPVVRARFADGSLAEGYVTAICAATGRLTDEQAGLAESILVALADQAGPAEIARAGRYLYAVLNPDGEDDDAEADYRQRFLLVRESSSGGLEGEFRLPREAGARLRALLDAYAKPRAVGDGRPLRVRNADTLIAVLERQIGTELLVLINAESLPDDLVGASACDTTIQGATAQDTTTHDSAAATGTGTRTGTRTGTEAGTESRTEAAAGPEVESARPGEQASDGAPRSGGMPGVQAVREELGAAWDDQASSPHEPTFPGAGAGPTWDERTPSQEGPCTTQHERAPFREGPGTAQHERTSSREGRNAVRDDQPSTVGEREAAWNGWRSAQGGPSAARDRPSTARDQPSAARDEPGPAQGERVSDWVTPDGLISGRRLPGLLLATGQFLPVSDVHRLANTSTLARLVMNADGEVLD